MVKIKIQKIRENAIIPKYAHKGDVGMDLYSTISVRIKPGHRALIPSGLKIALPKGYESQIRPKSGLALKEGVTVLNSPGTIEAEYRGEYGIVLINHSSKDVLVEEGQKVAQLVVKKVETVTVGVVESLDKTARGAGGFGSTGKK